MNRRIGLVVPVKGFGNAKARLADELDSTSRGHLAMAMAEKVLKAGEPYDCFVACDRRDVAEWARSVGGEPIDVSPDGLSQAVTDALAQLAAAGYDSAIVAHSDLPLVERFDHLVDPGHQEVVLVPDRHRDGTNVLITPLPDHPPLAYGPGSFLRHLWSASAAGMPVRIIQDDQLGWDVDHPADLDLGHQSVLDVMAPHLKAVR